MDFVRPLDSRWQPRLPSSCSRNQLRRHVPACFLLSQLPPVEVDRVFGHYEFADQKEAAAVARARLGGGDPAVRAKSDRVVFGLDVLTGWKAAGVWLEEERNRKAR